MNGTNFAPKTPNHRTATRHLLGNGYVISPAVADSMDHAELCGRRLKILGKATNLTLAELAEKVGIETKYLTNIETGRKKSVL